MVVQMRDKAGSIVRADLGRENDRGAASDGHYTMALKLHCIPSCSMCTSTILRLSTLLLHRLRRDGPTRLTCRSFGCRLDERDVLSLEQQPS